MKAASAKTTKSEAQSAQKSSGDGAQTLTPSGSQAQAHATLPLAEGSNAGVASSFTAHADAICASASQTGATAAREAPDAQTTTTLLVTQRTLAALERLSVPVRLSARFEQLLAALRHVVASAGAAAGATLTSAELEARQLSLEADVPACAPAASDKAASSAAPAPPSP